MSTDQRRDGARALLAIVFFGVLAALVAVFTVFPAVSARAEVPRGFTQAKVAGGISEPTAMAQAPDGRIFVAQQGGKLRVVKRGRVLQGPALSLRTDSRGERGLLGVAVDPGFSKNRFIYVYYTARSPFVHNRILRYTMNGDRAVVGSRRVILELNKLTAKQNHNGGAIHFGKDGKLYVAVGDNAGENNAQSLGNLKGKMLRINKDGSIPDDNPYLGRTRGKNGAIWALGLRNPFSFAVQPGTGKIFINDVGARRWEEINLGIGGSNYGWPRYEGPERDRDFRGPAFAYRHGETATTGCAITGGAFYNPANRTFPRAFTGDYFYADFCQGWIRRYDSGTDRSARFASASRPVDLLVGRGGDLFYISRDTNALHRIRYAR